MSICMTCKREGNWVAYCTPCLQAEILKTNSELQQLEAIKRDLEFKMTIEIQNAKNVAEVQNIQNILCLRCKGPRGVSNVPWCEKCLREDGLLIPDQKADGKERRWCSSHQRLEAGPPWPCFPGLNRMTFAEMHSSVVERANAVLHAAKYPELPQGEATDQEKADLEKIIRKRFPD